MGYNSITVGTATAILVVAFNHKRKSLIITNEGTSKIYLGDDISVTTNSSISIEADGKFSEDSGNTRVFLGDIYAISEDDTNDVRYWERE